MVNLLSIVTYQRVAAQSCIYHQHNQDGGAAARTVAAQHTTNVAVQIRIAQAV